MDHVSALIAVLIAWPFISLGVALIAGAAIRFGSGN